MNATPAYAEWVARGRAHQLERRPIDAMLCFRRALRADAQAAEPHFHLGEVLWQLGRLSEAIAAWREALRAAPIFLAPLQALAEALLATGDAAGAREAADRVLEVAPDNARASMIGGVARLLLGVASNGVLPAAVVAEAIRREPQLASVTTLAGPLALALDVARDASQRGMLLACVARMPAALASVPPLLHALALEYSAGTDEADAEYVREALVAEARARRYAPTDHDALRRIAVTTTEFDAVAARELAAAYAALCATGWAAPVPLLWPRRTAGDRLRVIALHSPSAAGNAAMLAVLAALPRESFAITIASIGGTALPVRDGAASLALPAQPDAATAKAIGAGDFDVLVDFAGLAAATGPLLAERPARMIWTVDALTLPNTAPLIDRVIDGADGLPAALSAAHASLDPRDECALDPVEMAAAWAEAVRAHQRGDRARARELYVRVLALQPGYVPGEYLYGIATRDAGDSEGARAAFAAALARAPGYVDARLGAARAAIDAGEHDAAIALCDEGLARAPGDARLLRVAGLAQLARRDGVAAAAAFQRALMQDCTDGETHYNHGVALQMQRNFDEGARAYQRALACQPDLAAARFNLGVLFQEQGATDAAIAAYSAVVDADPQSAAAYKSLGEVLHGAGRVDEWLANFRRFEAACPKALPLAVQALEVCQHLGDFAALERYLNGLAHEDFEADTEVELADCLEELLYLLLYFDIPMDIFRRFAQSYDVAARHVYGERLPCVPARRPGRLRVGYLSADLRNHVMGKMMWSALQYHDKGRFEIFSIRSPR